MIVHLLFSNTAVLKIQKTSNNIQAQAAKTIIIKLRFYIHEILHKNYPIFYSSCTNTLAITLNFLKFLYLFILTSITI